MKKIIILLIVVFCFVNLTKTLKSSSKTSKIFSFKLCNKRVWAIYREEIKICRKTTQKGSNELI